MGSFTAGVINLSLATVHFWQCCVPQYTSDHLLNDSRLWRRLVWLWAFDVHNRCTFVERGPPKQGPIKGLLLKDKDSSYKDQDKDQDFAVKNKDKDQDLTIKDQHKDKDFVIVLKESLKTRTRTNITDNTYISPRLNNSSNHVQYNHNV